MSIAIRAPRDDNEWAAYFLLRWQLLRAPWGQPQGSEKDELEEQAIHRLAMHDNQVIAVARLHFINPQAAQIRYMAVSPQFQNRGIATNLYQSLQTAAKNNNIKEIILHARENAVGFYEKLGFQNIEPSHVLYGTIPHYLMLKQLPDD